MVESTIVVASGDCGIPSLSGVVVYGSVCPAVYNSVQMCVYITLRPRERSVCAWLARMNACAIWGLVHALDVPPSILPMVPSCDRNCNTERNPVSLALKHTLSIFKVRAYSAAFAPSSRINHECVYIDADTGKASLTDVPQLHTCFIPRGVQ